MTAVPLGDRDDEAQVRVDHALLRREVATLDALGESDLLSGVEQLVAADLGQEQSERVGCHRAGAGGEVELEVVFLFGGGQLDAALGEEREQRAHALLVELVLERKRLELLCLDLAALFSVGDEGVKCRDIDDRCFHSSSFILDARQHAAPRLFRCVSLGGAAHAHAYSRGGAFSIVNG